MKAFLNISGRLIGAGQPVFVIAEAGCNHNGEIDLAKRLIDAAADAGADCVKFQTFHAEAVVSKAAPKAGYAIKATDPDESQLEMIQRLELSAGQHRELVDYCRRKGILFLSSVFDHQAVDLVDDLGLPAFKVPSGEIVNHPLLEDVAGRSKPIILSTGMSYLGEVEEAVRVIQRVGCRELALLHCLSNYPADPGQANLRAMTTMSAAFGLPVGYSDHVVGNEVSFAAVALGASIIEKHFTLDRSMPGPDHAASLEPPELAGLVQGIRKVEQALGDGLKRPMPDEENTRQVARKSLVAARDLPQGTKLTPEMVCFKRPGTGIQPAELKYVLGRAITGEVRADELITWEMLD
ncbi:MAG: N-acetylneuraminate synthase [Deltaproteobacteria bacterium]|nr:N-acetylneuraminate synthase [Deltaproteobacteria bacterium]